MRQLKAGIWPTFIYRAGIYHYATLNQVDKSEKFALHLIEKVEQSEKNLKNSDKEVLVVELGSLCNEFNEMEQVTKHIQATKKYVGKWRYG